MEQSNSQSLLSRFSVVSPAVRLGNLSAKKLPAKHHCFLIHDDKPSLSGWDRRVETTFHTPFHAN